MPELHLKVFETRSELVQPDGQSQTFIEGATNTDARQRYKTITDALEGGYLSSQIERCKNQPNTLLLDKLTDEQITVLDTLVDSVTSEVGRALVGLTILQLSVKAIEPRQSIRLHKGGTSRNHFSWRDGISMRTLDSNHITPTLRSHGLLKLNVFGFMMTRTLAENYPYSKVYKANIRGAQSQWVTIVEELESGSLVAESALQYVLSRLLNKAIDFTVLADATLETLTTLVAGRSLQSRQDVARLLQQHMNQSNYAARIMEIAMHSLMQAVQETGALGGATVIPLSQMRSANKKHGNIGDIEVEEQGHIIESWDAKFGKSYLRDEIEELNEKLAQHSHVDQAGFVTSVQPERVAELEPRLHDVAQLHGVSLEILMLDEWIAKQFARAIASGMTNEADLSSRWIIAYTESLAQRRLDVAPIDEPCYQWLESLHQLLLNEQ